MTARNGSSRILYYCVYTVGSLDGQDFSSVGRETCLNLQTPANVDLGATDGNLHRICRPCLIAFFQPKECVSGAPVRSNVTASC